MGAALKSSWALFLGLWLIMAGNGLQGSLVAIRAQMEVFGNTVTGLIMAGYFAGFFLGSFIVPTLLARVGHVRVFAALAAMASLAILIYPLFVHPVAWIAMRVITGLAYAGLYVVCESWMNEKATNENRGQMLAVYMVVSLTGIAAGQLLLNIYPPSDFQLFTVVSVLISVAAIPVLLSATAAPVVEAPERLGPLKLYRLSPLGVVAITFSGVMMGIVMGMGPAYAYQMFGTSFAALFMMAVFIGGFLFTWPVGRLSDRFDRRTVIVCVALLCGVTAVLSTLFPEPQTQGERFIAAYQDGNSTEIIQGVLLLATLIFGGFALPLYSLSIAHTNDYLTPSQLVGASSTLVMANGFGAMLGPNLAGLAMDLSGSRGYFVSLAGVSFVLVLFGLWRMTRRPPLPAEEQGSFVAIDGRMGTMAVAALHPDAEWPEERDGEDEKPDVEDEEEVPGAETVKP